MFTVYSSSKLRGPIFSLRSLASLSPSQIGTSPFKVFDRHVKRLQKDRAVACDGGNRSRTVDYVRDEVANRMLERFLASVYPVVLLFDLAETHLGHKAKVHLHP